MLKIQSKSRGGDWEMATRAGSILNAWSILHAYRCDYPLEEHRLIFAHPDGTIVVIPDNADELQIAAEIRAADEETESMIKTVSSLLDRLEVAKLEDIIGKTIIDVQQQGEGVEITFSDNSMCQFLLTDEKELMFVTDSSS